ncbi:cytochrome P450 [Podospora australis]|uniref:Cytochrome P450 n=1 Tax=Podospora australis TaxID=1536484 RepID=A0AAN7ADC7_9PEZI|nr:cytochrome P450 [Podospora australis]
MAQEYKLKGVTSLDLKPGDKQEVEIEGIEGAKVLLLNAGACFNGKTGDVEDAPALDALPVFKAVERDGAVYITGDEASIKSGHRRPSKFKCKATGGDKIVVVGGGSGSLGTVEGLRENGYKGPITVITNEGYLPIDRPKLSKALMTDLQKLQWRDEEFFKTGDVEFVQDEVTGVNFGSKTVATKAGGKFAYTKLVLATGGTPRVLPLQGFKVLGNIFTLRNVGDAKKINEAIGEKGKKIVIIGSSFIGMELAVATSNGNDVTVVGMEKVPLERILGEKVGGAIQKLVESKGVKFYMSAGVEKAEPSTSNPSTVGSVHLKDGTKLDADLVILGVGVVPATEYLKDNSVVELQQDGSLKVDEYFSVVGLKDVYAIGDIASFPYHGPAGDGKYVRIEHWNVAQKAGRIVAGHITNPARADIQSQVFAPIFWSALGAQMRYAGNTQANGYDDVVVQGSFDEGKWVAYYTKGETVVAMASMGKDPAMAQFAQLLPLGKLPSKTELQNGLDILIETDCLRLASSGMPPVIYIAFCVVWRFTQLTVIGLLTVIVYRIGFHPLRRVPGPKLAAISNIWQAKYVRDGKVRQLVRDVHEKYGPVVRVGPDEVWVSSPEGFKAIYGASNGFEKSDFYIATALNRPEGIDWHLNLHWPDTLDLLSEFDTKRYRLQRRLIGPVYASSNVKKFEPAVEEVLERAIAELKKLEREGSELDLKEWMHILAVECLGAAVLSWSPNYIQQRSDGGTSGQSYLGWKRKSVFGLFPLITKISFWSKGISRWWANAWGVTFTTPKGFKPFFTPVYQKSSKRVTAALALAQKRADQQQKQPQKPSKKAPKSKPAEKKDLLEDLIQLHLARPDEFTETYLRRLAVTNFGAGHETLCSTLTAAIAMIASHEHVQRHVADEAWLSRSHRGTKETTATAPYAYTQAAIKEAQRLWPVIGMVLPRRVPYSHTINIGGYDIPGGTTVGCAPLVLHLDEGVFGPQADTYEPGRWLPSTSPAHRPATPDEQEEQIRRLREMERCNLIWGGGGRTCPGRFLAEMIIRKVVTALVGEFEVAITSGLPIDAANEERMSCYFMAMMSGVKVRFRSRRDKGLTDLGAEEEEAEEGRAVSGKTR